MLFSIATIAYFASFATASPLVARQEYSNSTSTALSSSSVAPSTSSFSSSAAPAASTIAPTRNDTEGGVSGSQPGFGATGLLPSNGTDNLGPGSIVPQTGSNTSSTARNDTAGGVSGSQPGFGATGLLPSNGTNNLGPNSIVPQTGTRNDTAGGVSGSQPGFGATGLLPSNGTNNLGPNSIVPQTGPYNNGTGAGVGAGSTSVGAPVVTVYQAEVCVTVINDITVIVDLYGKPVTTAVGGVQYTIQPSPQKTVTVTSGSAPTVVVGPVSQTPIPAVTTTVTVGSVQTVVVYVPSAGPTSTQGAPAPATTVAPTYQYTAAAGGVCECPLPTTVTQYVTVQTSATATQAASTSAVAASNCVYPNVAAAPTLFPGFIIPVQEKNPSTAYGTVYTAEVNADQEIVFQFDVQKTGTCSIELALPAVDTLTTSSWTASGNGDFSLAKLPLSVDQSVTFAKLPTALDYTSFPIVQNGTATIGQSFNCVAGTTATFVLKSTNGASLKFFEDYNCPYVGLALIES